jgi:flagellar assembly protein FliH
MATVIQSDNLNRHNVDKYNFKIIALGNQVDSKSNAPKSVEKYTPENNPKARASDNVDSSALSNSSKESLIESLMKKTDEMSSNFIKLQMKLESKEEEFKEELKKAKEEAFAQGLEAGKAQAGKDLEKNINESLDMFSNSVLKLENSAKEYDMALEVIKNELITAALDISKEVVKIELSQSSNEIAKILSDELINDLQDASKITLKVNPKNHGAISEHVGKLEHIDVVSDSAVAEGGVIVISDAGNIDSQISKRFERVKQAVLSE